MSKRFTKMMAAVCAAVLALFSSAVKAENDADYRKYADGVRKEVYAMPMPEFSNPKIPDELKNKSSVVMARYTDVSVGKQLKLAFNFGISLSNDVLLTRMTRELVYIGDESTLKEYSEYEFQTHSKNWTGYGVDRQKRVLGIRVIKKDGTVSEVPTDDYIIESEGYKDKNKTHKLAVPGLQIGDFVDVMFHTVTRYQNHSFEPMYFTFFDTKPVLSDKYHCVINKDLATFYRCFNGAKRFVESTNADGDIVLDATVLNEPQFPEFWVKYSAQVPYIQLQIYHLKSDKPKSAQSGLRYVEDYETQLKDAWAGMSFGKIPFYPLSKDAKQVIRNCEKLSDKEKVERIYNVMLLMSINGHSYWGVESFLNEFGKALKKAGISFKPFFTTDEDDEPIDELGTYYNAYPGIYIPSVDEYYVKPVAIMPAGEIPASFSGRKAFVTDEKGTTWSPVTLPSYTAEQNKEKYDVAVKFDGTKLNVSRRLELSGLRKTSAQMRLLTFGDFDSSLRRNAGTKEKSYEEYIWAEFDSNTRAGKIEEIRKAREKQLENVKSEIENFHGKDVQVDFKSFKVESYGTRRDSSSFVFNVDYEISNLVKKAGKNLMLSVGELLGRQTTLDENERKRNVDIYYKPRTFEHTVRVDLPSGYTVSAEALGKLNVNVANECAEFVAKASLNGSQLVVEMRKVYKNDHEPVSNWNKIVEVVDAAKNYQNMQVVLSK